jgi:hypothetical protein
VEVRRRVLGAGTAVASVLAGLVVVVGVVVVGVVVGGGVVGVWGGVAGASTPSAAALYKDALDTTHAWSVHYDSSSTQTNVTLVESGDAGPAGASQTVMMGRGSIEILVIGGLSYVKGNSNGLQNLAGLSTTQANEAAGQWIEFSTDNSAFAPVVEGVRSSDIAAELALKGPISLRRTRSLHGEAVDALEGTQSVEKKTIHVVLYVRAKGAHVPVEEDSVNSQGKATNAEHIVYSKWGERVRPEAPRATISVGPISAV